MLKIIEGYQVEDTEFKSEKVGNITFDRLIKIKYQGKWYNYLDYDTEEDNYLVNE